MRTYVFNVSGCAGREWGGGRSWRVRSGEGSSPASQLWTMRLTASQAEMLLEQALRNIEIMLGCHVVHSDLSAYNMLCAGGRLRIIDFPQSVDARSNRNAATLLARDVANVCRYFASQGADAEPGTFAAELWDLYARPELWLGTTCCPMRPRIVH